MRRHPRLISALAALLALPFVYGGCVIVISSGDNERDKDKPEQPPVIAPAVITAENAVEFAAGAVAGGPASGALAGAAVTKASEQGFANALRTLRLPLALADALGRIEPDPAVVLFSPADSIAEKGSVPGTCGGRFVYTVDFAREAQAFSGDLEFENYCVDRFVISNRTRVSGVFERSTGGIVSARFTFEDLTAEGLSYAGDLQMDLFSDAIEASMSVDTAAGSGSANGFSLSGYTVDIVQYPGFSELEISGTYIHPAYGAVELKTTEPFIVYPEDRWPASGTAVVSGRDATCAALTVVDYLRFTVDADANGGGRFASTSGMHYWERF